MLLEVLFGALEHIVLDLFQEFSDPGLQALQSALFLGAVVSAGDDALAVLEVAGADLHAEREAAHLLVRELEAGALVAVVDLDAEIAEDFLELIGLVQDAGLALLDRYDHDLGGRDAGRQDQTGIIAVDHDQGADNAGRQTPGGLEGMLLLVVFICEKNAIGLCEVVAEVVAGAGLEGAAVVHQGLDGVGRDGTCKFLLVGLSALDGGDGQILRAEIRIDVQHLLGPGLRLLGGRVDSVALLPHEFTGAEEGTGLLLPAHDAAPLVVDLGQVAVGLDLTAVEIAEQGLRGRTDAGALVELLGTARGDPGDLGGKALDQVLLLVEQALRDQQGQIDVLYADRLKPRVQVLLYSLPDRVARGLVDHEALDIGIGDQACLDADVCIPLCKVLIHRRDLGDQFFLFCHLCSSPPRASPPVVYGC